MDMLQNLSVSPVYNFTSAVGDNVNRFTLHFSTVGMDDNPAESGPVIYAYGKFVYINSSEITAADIYIRNLTGQLVKQSKFNGTSAIDLSNLPMGVYVVSMADKNSVHSCKIVLK